MNERGPIIKNPPEQNRDLKKLLYRVKEKGSPDLSEASPTEREVLLDWYKSNKVSEKDQVDFMEEFMLHGVVDDETALGFIKSMNSNQKAQLGEYLGRVVKPGKYLQSFYECYEEIDYDTREKLTKSLSTSREGFLMIAPFKDLQEIEIKKITDDKKPVSEKNVLESEFSSIDDAKNLFDALLKYYEEHPDIQSYSNILVDRHKGSRQTTNFFHSTTGTNLKHIVDHYRNRQAGALFPYLEKFVKLGFLTEDQAKSLFVGVRQIFIPSLTKEEAAEIKRLKRKMKGSEEGDFYFYSASDAIPQRYGVEIEKIQDRAAVRSVKSILTNFKKHKETFQPNPLKFLQELTGWGAPIFSVVEQLGLSREEVRTLLLRSHQEDSSFFNLRGYGDMKHLLEWNREQKEGPDLEKTVTSLFIQFISDGENENIAFYLRDILSWFEKANRNKIIKAINQRVPNLWLLSLPYAIENQVMPLDTLIVKSAEQNPHWYLYYFHNLLYEIAILKKKDRDTAVELDNIRKLARKIILENPSYFFDEKLNCVIDEVFSQAEKQSFIENQLKEDPVDLVFFRRLITSDKLKQYSETCRKIFLSNPRLFAEMAENKEVSDILSIREISDLLIQNVDSIDFEQITDRNDTLIPNLLRSPENLDRLLDAVKQSNSSGLIALAVALNSIKEKRGESISEWKSEIKVSAQQLNELFYLRAIASSVDKRKIQLKIDRMRSNLVKLRANKPVERKTEQEIEGLADEYREKLKGEVKKLCESEKFLIFQTNALDILGNDANQILRRDIEEYVTIYPEVLLREHSKYSDRQKYGNLLFQELLGEREFSRLFKSRIRTFAFWTGRYGSAINADKLPSDLVREVTLRNRILEFRNKTSLKNDFYLSILATIQDYQFYPLYADKLKKIADKEVGIYGPRLETEFFEPNSEFSSLVKTISLLEDCDLAQKNKEGILHLTPHRQNEFIKMMEFISYYHLDKDLDFDLSQDNYSEVRQDVLAHILDFSKKLFEIEGVEVSTMEPVSIRTINALSIYYNKSCRENPLMKQGFHRVISPIVAGNYKNWRGWGQKEPPSDRPSAEKRLEDLKKQGLLPSKLSLDQYAEWLRDRSLSFTETFTYQMSDVQSGIKNIFSLAVVDGHIEEETMNIDSFVLANDYQELLRPVRDLSKKQQEYKRRIQLSKKGQEQPLTPEETEEYENIKSEIKEYREEHELDIKRIEALRYVDKLKRLSTEELELESLLIDRKKISFADVFKELEIAFNDKPDFLSDIRRIRELLMEGGRHLFQGSRVSRSELTITDKIDLETYVYIGEKPVESCQHYDGSDLNYGLLSYISDPAIKIGQIWDENGNIVARCVFRLLEDENQNPQIFMERIYSVNIHPKIKEVMIRFGVQIAKSMNIEVFTQEEEYKELTNNNMKTGDKVVLQSKGSRSPYTYTDAGGGKVPNGIFKIEVYA